MTLLPIAEGRYTVVAMVGQDGRCQVLELLNDLVGSRYPPARDAVDFLDDTVAVLGPRYYPQLVKEIGGGLAEFEFPDPHEPGVRLCVLWFQHYSTVVCVRAYFRQDDESPDEDLLEGRKMQEEYRLMTGGGSGGSYGPH